MNDQQLAEEFKNTCEKLKKEVSKVIIGQDEVVSGILTTIFCNGHVLLVGVPGLAKTLLIRTMASVLDLSFSRIQFTPDLMPSDITGAEILDENRKFNFIRGPLFANMVLADEINRTPPKTQSALLEAMQERHITVAGQQHKLAEPFFVLATQNPIEQEGTYPLPEAQLDRFMFNIILDYPSFEEEVNIIKATTGDKTPDPQKIIDDRQIVAFQGLVRRVPVPDNVFEYAVKLVTKTRPVEGNTSTDVSNYLSYGAGPRAGQFLILGAKCHALMNGKFSPDIEDVKAVAMNVLRHRVVKNYRAEAEGLKTDDILKKLL